MNAVLPNRTINQLDHSGKIKAQHNTSIEKLSFTSVNRLYNKSNGTKNRQGYNMV
ncbi:MAG: hypothetical protein LUQ68_03170 [Methylococcaceae bacterium]|nr:hypothetical protein [Methylococcaceae bacterium]